MTEDNIRWVDVEAMRRVEKRVVLKWVRVGLEIEEIVGEARWLLEFDWS